MGAARRKALEFHKAPRYAHTVLPRHRRGQTRIRLLRQLRLLCFARRRSFRLGKENGLKTRALKSIKTGCSILLQPVFQLSTFLCKSVYQKISPQSCEQRKRPAKEWRRVWVSLPFQYTEKRYREKPDTFVGGPEEIRTLDFYNANVALSQLSYRPVNPIIITRGG